MIKYIKKLIKKQILLNKYKKGSKQWSDHIWLLKNFGGNKIGRQFFEHEFHCELKCYNRLKKL